MDKNRLNKIVQDYETVAEIAQDFDETLEHIKSICISVGITSDEKIKQINSIVTTILIS